ncbi:hypothetical protein [Nocardiopsis nanhaiensis]
MRPHESFPNSPAAAPYQAHHAYQAQVGTGDRTSPWFIVLWLLVAVPVVFLGLYIFGGVALSAAMTEVPSGVGALAIFSMLFLALFGIPLSLWHFGLVCSLRRSRARKLLLTLQSVYVPLFFVIGWALIQYANQFPVST